MSDRPTLKSLSADVASLTEAMSKLRPADSEARVIAGCARALDEIPRRSNGNYDGAALVPDHAAVGRVLDYLRQRYGLPDPSQEANRLRAELEQAQQRNSELESRLYQITSAVRS